MKGLLFTLGLTYGGCVVSLFNPWYGLLIYICFAILKPSALWFWSVPQANYSRVIGIAFLVGWALNGFGDRTLGKARPIVVAILGYFLWMILSTVFSPQPELGMANVEVHAKIVLPFIAAITLVNSWRQLQQLLWVIVGCCTFLAFEANKAYLGGYSVSLYGFLGMDNNTFAILMSAGFGLPLVLAFYEERAWIKLGYFAIAAAMAHVPMLAFSRGGMLGLCMASTVALVVVPKKGRNWLMILAAALVASVLAGPSVVARFSTTFNDEEIRDASAQSRVELWRDCIDATLRNPIFGVGQSRWGQVAPTYGWPLGKEAHSLWFQTAAELGIPGVTFLILFYVFTITKTWQAQYYDDTFRMPLLAQLVAVSLAGFVASASFVTATGLELPFYIALLGACGVKLTYATSPGVEHSCDITHYGIDGLSAS